MQHGDLVVLEVQRAACEVAGGGGGVGYKGVREWLAGPADTSRAGVPADSADRDKNIKVQVTRIGDRLARCGRWEPAVGPVPKLGKACGEATLTVCQRQHPAKTHQPSGSRRRTSRP